MCARIYGAMPVLGLALLTHFYETWYEQQCSALITINSVAM
jgi:hypothetical protein